MPKLRSILALALLCSSVSTGFADPGDDGADNLAAIVRFVEAHRLDISDADPHNTGGILGSKEDALTYRVISGLGGVQHENLKKFHGGKGWYYLATLRDFATSDRAAAAAYAAARWAQLQPELEAQGFTLRKDNPWHTYTMTKPAAQGVIQVWLDFGEASDGTHVTLRLSPNI